MPDQFGRTGYYSPRVDHPGDPDYAEGDEIAEDCTSRPPNLVASRCEDGMHRPVLDIDFPARLVPSSTEGHFHLYLDGLALTWEKYRSLIAALAMAGVIEEGYAAASLRRGYTAVRPEGHQRPEPRRGAEATATWVDETVEVTAEVAAFRDSVQRLADASRRARTHVIDLAQEEEPVVDRELADLLADQIQTAAESWFPDQPTEVTVRGPAELASEMRYIRFNDGLAASRVWFQPLDTDGNPSGERVEVTTGPATVTEERPWYYLPSGNRTYDRDGAMMAWRSATTAGRRRGADNGHIQLSRAGLDGVRRLVDSTDRGPNEARLMAYGYPTWWQPIRCYPVSPDAF